MVGDTTTREDLKAALPDTSGTVSLKGLGASAEIHRDGHGIPHVRAQSVRDASFAQGFATAQDRLWHMDYDRRRAYGRWAEFAGPQGVEQDKMMRRFRLESSARADYLVVAEKTREMLDAYAAGVNAFIETTQALPVEYSVVGGTPEPWQPWDGLAIFKVRHIFMGVFEAKLWRMRLVKHLGPERTAMLFPSYPKGELQVVPPGTKYSGQAEDGLEELIRGAQALKLLSGTAGSISGEPDIAGIPESILSVKKETEAGSNNWALSGSRTASGKPLVAGDPHRGLETPNVYYQNHLACPDFDVVGLSFPGIPGFPHFGHNDSVAWCVTHAGADYQDLFIERFNDDDPQLYEYKDEWKRAESHHETIAVRGANPVEMDVTVTHHGPIIFGDPAEGCGVAFRYTATAAPIKHADALLQMLRARSADELEESMRSWVDPANSFVFADVHGDIGYLTRGQVPVRSSANAWIPVPGWSGEHEWEGVVPFEEMPRSRNPETGYIVTANNRITGVDYPHYIAFDYTPWFRATRVTHRLLSLGKEVKAKDMTAVHADRVSVPAQSYIQLLSKIQPLDKVSARAKEMLLAWDGTMDRDGVAPTIYSAFLESLVREVMGHALGPLAHEALEEMGPGGPTHVTRLRAHFPAMIQKDDRSLLPEGSDWNSIMATALAKGVAKLHQELGEDMEPWRWGRVHRTVPQHSLSTSFPQLAGLLDPPSVPFGGDGDTPQAAGYSLARPCLMTSTSVARYVFDLSDWNNSAWIVPLGASGHPGSPHYADQTPIWAEVQLVPMLYDWERITAQAQSHQTLRPAQDSP